LIPAALGAFLVLAGVLSLPTDRRLGEITRLVFFHGAFVWTAILLSLLGGVLAVMYLARGGGARERGSQERNLSWVLSLSTVAWVIVFGLSFPVMLLSWGGILWTEGRLVMAMLVVSLYLIVWAVAFMWEKTVVAALGLLVSALAVVGMVLLVPARFHPDNPVFGSGDPRFIGGFLLILGGMVLVATALLAWRWRRSPVPDPVAA
jgi:hypothetical protein